MEFKSNIQGQCPICGENNLSWGDSDFQGEYIGYEWICDNCGHRGTEWYRMIFDGHEVQIETRDGIFDYENVNDYIEPQN